MKKKYASALSRVWLLALILSVQQTRAQNCWAPLGAGVGNNPDYDGVTAMASFNGNLVVGGFFDSIGNIAANGVASWNGTSWSAMGQGINTLFNNNSYISLNALAVYNNELYAGGSFTMAGQVPVYGIARWSGTQWVAVGSGLGFYVSNGDTLYPSVNCLAVYNGSLFAGGAFYTANGNVVNNVAMWNGTSWSAVGAGLGSGVNTRSAVFCMDTLNGLLYAGGGFINASGLTAYNIASWNGTTWAALGNGVGPDTLGGGGVITMTTYDGNILAGVISEDASLNQYFSISKWDGTAWSSFLGGPGTGVYYPGVLQNLYAFNGGVIAEGAIDTVGNASAPQGLAFYNGSTWTDFSVNNDTALYYTATTYNNHLYVGGFYNNAGVSTSFDVAEYTCATTGINEIAAGNQVHIYPNPTNGIISISADNLQDKATIQIYNLLGQRVVQSTLNSEKTELNLTGQSSGTYLYRISGQNGEAVRAGTFVVQ